MHGNVPVRFGRGRLDSLDNKGLAAYLIGFEVWLACAGQWVLRALHLDANLRRCVRPECATNRSARASDVGLVAAVPGVLRLLGSGWGRQGRGLG